LTTLYGVQSPYVPSNCIKTADEPGFWPFKITEIRTERRGRGDAGHSLLDPLSASLTSLWGIAARWQHVVFEHWNSRRRHGRQLFRTLQNDGSWGSYPTLARYLQRLRAAQGIVLARKPAKQPRPVLVAAPRRVLTPRTAA